MVAGEKLCGGLETLGGAPRRGSSSLARKVLRYLAVSAVNVVLGETTIAVAFGLLHWSGPASAVLATVVATVPAYFLSRMWVWGRRGRSNVFTEVLPFWTMAFFSLAVSTVAAGWAEHVAKHLTHDRREQTGIVMVAVLATFGVLWVARFLVLDAVLFRDRSGRDRYAMSDAG